ncbi:MULTISPECIES: hypothetical protein [Acidobacterium]|uniref:Uncharacterized protein n=1 Tax=Acidobacterium capsulatum (strain ATCC 51196 / DSM 11244 / BCRC 80197 / JCM 7670 / NBRC 15755 / NCIMB 13165 / 161) TaxID=240015 RepID=C1F6T4_ACIC5|nr:MULTISPECIES: hypothetical protein [Acidobacterium]ACO33778.1 hypothetical protein ACP_1592 [Acidobacterium capsulatum ATCC 51196]
MIGITSECRGIVVFDFNALPQEISIREGESAIQIAPSLRLGIPAILTALQPLPARSAGEHTHLDRILDENYRIAYSPQVVTLDLHPQFVLFKPAVGLSGVVDPIPAKEPVQYRATRIVLNGYIGLFSPVEDVSMNG